MTDESSPVRLGVIGTGGMATVHMKHARELEGVEISAVCDISPKALKKASDSNNCPGFDRHTELLSADICDAVLIATPHYGHTTIGIDALKAGKHVLVEKPISVHKADCERLIAAHTDKNLVFAAMFNQRTDPYYIKLKQMIDEGELGGLVRVSWIITDWFRTDSYYAGGGWRATWEGEGGGVLLNQCPHQLDLMQWLFGMPTRVAGFCGIGKRHDIEVEDQVTAYLEYENGATGTFISSTGEAPGTNRLEVAGERGRVIIEDDTFTFIKNAVPADEFLHTSKESFARPETETIDIPIDNHGGQHKQVLQNFIDAVQTGTPLIAPASDGVRSVELGNAMLYASLTGTPVQMPLDAAAYEQKLMKLIADSTHIKKAGPAGSHDLSTSF